MFSPIAVAPKRVRTWLLLRMYKTPSRLTSAPRVPAQQVVAERASGLPPEVPSWIGGTCRAVFAASAGKAPRTRRTRRIRRMPSRMGRRRYARNIAPGYLISRDLQLRTGGAARATPSRRSRSGRFRACLGATLYDGPLFPSVEGV